MIRCGATSRPVATMACAPTSAAITITAAMMTATTSVTVELYGITIARSVAAIDLNPRKAGTHASLPPVTVIEASGAAFELNNNWPATDFLHENGTDDVGFYFANRLSDR